MLCLLSSLSKCFENALSFQHQRLPRSTAQLLEVGEQAVDACGVNANEMHGLGSLRRASKGIFFHAAWAL